MDNKGLFNISLRNNNGYSWTESDGSWVKGFAFAGNVLYEKESLLDYCVRVISCKDRNRMLSMLNGAFLVVAVVDGNLYMITDKMRCFPLLYSLEGNTVYVSDTGDDIAASFSWPELNTDNVPYFLSCGYLYGGETLLRNCFIVAPASIVSFENGNVTAEAYCSRKHAKTVAGAGFNDRAMSVVERMADRLRKISDGRQIVIPLSGGYDSRLVACMCKHAGLENVVCYTYGLDTSKEIETAVKVASSLGYRLYRIGISEDKWKEIFKTGMVKEYLAYGGNIDAVAHMQDFFAVYELKAKKMVSDNAFFVPGHTGDLLAGNHFLQGVSPENIIKKVFDKYFIINVLNRKDKKAVKARLRRQLSSFSGLSTAEDCYEAIYQWNISCRQPNYIINSVRAYEFFGYSWYLPLWDDEFVNLWSSVSCLQRKDEDLYANFVFERFFVPYSVDFRKENAGKSRLKEFMNGYLSFGDKYRIRKLLSFLHLYSFKDDNSMLNIASGYIRKYGLYSGCKLLPCKEDSMSAKSLFYLYRLNNYCNGRM